jgi:hypothetical protein
MIKKFFILLLCSQISIFCFSQAAQSFYTPVETSFYFNWGHDSTKILLTQYGSRKGLVMVHLHDDEFASAEAGKKILSKTGGLFIEVKNNGKRLISFKKNGKRFQFDPNRIFTAKGRSQNLHLLNKTITAEAMSLVKAFASFILKKVPRTVATLVAIHNNQNGNYSVNSYKAGSHSKGVAKWYSNQKKDPDNFFIVNNSEMFRQIKKSGFNVVFQNNLKAQDDGSLSIYYGKKNLVYVNIEAEQGDLDEQTKMLNGLFYTLQ